MTKRNLYILILSHKHLFRRYTKSITCYALNDVNQYPSENNSEINTVDNQHDIKPDILDASLDYVNEYGWSKYAIVKGALSLGLPAVIQGVFKRGGFDLIHYFNKKSNEQFEEILKKNFIFPIESHKQEIPTEYLIQAFQIRLGLIKPYLKKWPEVAWQSSYPENIKDALGSLLETADLIRSYAGCRDGTGPEWYARRFQIAAIYRLVEMDFVRRSMSTKTTTQIPLRFGDEVEENVTADRPGFQLSNEECWVVSTLVEKLLMIGTSISKPLEVVFLSLGNAIRPNDSRNIQSTVMNIQKLVENVHPTFALARNLLGIRSR